MSVPVSTGRNPFEPPRAALERAPGASERLFFTASTPKLIVMALVTFNFYVLYWFYRNFQAIKAREGSAIMPFWRAFFSPLWAYACFREIANAGKRARTGQAAGLAFVYFVLNILTGLPDPYWLLSLASFVTLLAPNAWARDHNRSLDPQFEENDRFTAANWAWITVGGLFTALVLAAVILAPQP